MNKRECGTCRLCCTLLPVKELNKAGNQVCQHECEKGCAIYGQHPISCKLWSCVWLTDAERTWDMQRPDQCHYVVDPMPDYVTVVDKDGKSHKVPVIQVWLHPDHPDAHRDPALRRLLTYAKRPAIARLPTPDGGQSAIIVVPPALNGGQWGEYASNLSAEPEHTARDIMETLEGK